MTDWEKQKAVGMMGEQIVLNRFREKGFLVYAVDPNEDKPHLIDAFVMNPDKQIKGLEVKTVQNYGGDTFGLKCFAILKRHWLEYRNWCYESGVGLNLYIIDRLTNKLYYQKFRTVDRIEMIKHKGLEFTFPKRHIQKHSGAECLLFPVSWFTFVDDLTKEEIITLG